MGLSVLTVAETEEWATSAGFGGVSDYTKYGFCYVEGKNSVSVQIVLLSCSMQSFRFKLFHLLSLQIFFFNFSFL